MLSEQDKRKQSVINMEVKILGVISKKPKVLYDIRRKLSDEMFSVDAHKIIYRKITQLFDDTSLPNLDMLRAYLDASGMLETIGGESYLNYIYTSTNEVDEENIEKYVELISRAFKSRRILKISEYARKLEDNFTVVNDVIYDIRTELEYIDSKGFKSNTAHISEFLQDSWRNTKEKVENPGIVGITTGYKNIDSITGGYRKGQYWIIGGRPSHGKTAFAINSMIKAAKAGTSVLLFSLEMNENQIVDRIASVMSRIHHIKIMLGTMTEEEVGLLKDTYRKIKELPIYISTTFSLDAEEIVRTIKEQSITNKVEAVWIDYVQLTTEREGDAVHTIGQISRKCKLLAKELNIHICIISQLNRGVEQRDNKRPVKADLRQSGNLEEDADLIAFIYRDEIYNKNDDSNKGRMEFIIDKHRNGPVGIINLRFNEDLMEIWDG